MKMLMTAFTLLATFASTDANVLDIAVGAGSCSHYCTPGSGDLGNCVWVADCLRPAPSNEPITANLADFDSLRFTFNAHQNTVFRYNAHPESLFTGWYYVFTLTGETPNQTGSPLGMSGHLEFLDAPAQNFTIGGAAWVMPDGTSLLCDFEGYKMETYFPDDFIFTGLSLVVDLKPLRDYLLTSQTFTVSGGALDIHMLVDAVPGVEPAPVFEVVAVPEPSTLVAVCGFIALMTGVGLRRRFKRSEGE